MNAKRRQALSAVIAAAVMTGVPAANAVAAFRASPPGNSSVKEKAKAAAAKAAAAKAAKAKAAAAKAAATRKAGPAARTAATTTAGATTAASTAPTIITTASGTVTVGPPLDPLPTSTAARPSAATGEHTYAGDPVEMDQWGPVTVTIVVENGTIVDVSADLPMERARSNYINSRVGPYLSAQALKLQSARLDLISGATRTSFAYKESLQSALDRAGITP